MRYDALHGSLRLVAARRWDAAVAASPPFYHQPNFNPICPPLLDEASPSMPR